MQVWSLLLGYVGALCFWWGPPTEGPLTALSPVIWLALVSHLASVAGVWRMPILVVVLALLVMGFLAELRNGSLGDDHTGERVTSLGLSPAQCAGKAAPFVPCCAPCYMPLHLGASCYILLHFTKKKNILHAGHITLLLLKLIAQALVYCRIVIVGFRKPSEFLIIASNSLLFHLNSVSNTAGTRNLVNVSHCLWYVRIG